MVQVGDSGEGAGVLGADEAEEVPQLGERDADVGHNATECEVGPLLLELARSEGAPVLRHRLRGDRLGAEGALHVRAVLRGRRRRAQARHGVLQRAKRLASLLPHGAEVLLQVRGWGRRALQAGPGLSLLSQDTKGLLEAATQERGVAARGGAVRGAGHLVLAAQKLPLGGAVGDCVALREAVPPRALGEGAGSLLRQRRQADPLGLRRRCLGSPSVAVEEGRHGSAGAVRHRAGTRRTLQSAPHPSL